MLKFVPAISAIALVAVSGPASAQQAASPPAGQAPAQDPKTRDHMNEVVCQKQEVIGSRLATKRICKTRAEWADHQLQDRQGIEKIQVNRGMPGN